MPRSHIRVRHGHNGRSHTVKHDGKRGPGRVPTRKTSARYAGKERNPFEVIERPHPIYPGEVIRRVKALPVRMKLPRLRRCV